MVYEKKQRVPQLDLSGRKRGGWQSSNIILLEESAGANFEVISMGLLVSREWGGVWSDSQVCSLAFSFLTFCFSLLLLVWTEIMSFKSENIMFNGSIIYYYVE